MQNNNEQEIKFPVDWTYRIIIESVKEAVVIPEIKKLMAEFGVTDELKATSVSSSGTYKTFAFTKLLASHEEMENIANTIHALDGVKVVI
jgi:putative lipoic acid-binding regulatory protein